jgi:hypothetical protein
MPRWKLLGFVFVLLLAGCYHQVVRTGAPAGNVVVERPWTATYLFGLVPAAAINTAAQCPTGVAIVETQQSFLNSLVGGLTLGIYTPQTVRITCAAGPTAAGDALHIQVAPAAGVEARAAALEEAVARAYRSGETTVVFLGF